MSTPGRKFMIAHASQLGASVQRLQRPRIPGDAAAWSRLVTEAGREGMSGMLYRGLQQEALIEQAPASARARLTAAYYHTLRFNLKLMADLEEILAVSDGVGVTPLVLQGMALQGDVYADPGLRPMSDIDLWVAPEAFRSFAALLGRLAYRQSSLYPGTFERGPTKLDIHTHLFWADRLKSRRWLLRGDVGEFIRNAETFHVNGTPALRLSAVDQVLYLGMHALKHNVDRLIWLVDIQRVLSLMPAGGVGGVMGRAAAFGLSRQMAYVGFLIERLLGESTDLGRETAVGPMASWILRFRDNRDALPVWAPLVLFTSGKDPRLGAAMAWEMAFPEVAVLRQVFADTSSASSRQLYLRRINQLIRMLK